MELPRLKPIFEKYKDQGLRIVVIDGLNMTEQGQQFIKENDLTYTFLEHGEGEENIVKNMFGIRSFPSSFLVDQEGKIRFFHFGFRQGDEVEIEEQIVSLLKE